MSVKSSKQPDRDSQTGGSDTGYTPRSIDCRGKVALVTGASRGIGRATALALAHHGAAVVVNYREQEAAARQVASTIEQQGGRAMVCRADLRVPADLAALVQQSVSEFGAIDILVNNAGIVRDNFLVFMKEEEWADVLDLDLTAVFRVMKAVARIMMRQRRGRIVNVSSAAAMTGDLRRANYSAAKAGLLGLTRSAARELAASGITVNAVAPGLIDTDMTRTLDNAARAKRLAPVPLSRFGAPAEVAALIVFLASDAAAYMTGQVVGVDGGLHM